MSQKNTISQDAWDKMIASGLGFTRTQGAHIDECKVALDLLDNVSENKTMLDVGACYGSEALPFLRKDWQVYCFEPDAKNRKRLTKNVAHFDKAMIDHRALSDFAEKNVSFYQSAESTGISTLSPFHASHRRAGGNVDVVTLREAMQEYELDSVGFLKIDVEGHDFQVLRGLDWQKCQPDMILCEFEDSKTLQFGHNWQDMCEFLIAKGYVVYVSEWHKVTRYGIRHDWHRVFKFPDILHDDEAWGNLLAVNVRFSEADVMQAFLKNMQFSATKKSPRQKPKKLVYFIENLLIHIPIPYLYRVMRWCYQQIKNRGF